MNTDFTKSIEELHREAIGEAPAELMTEGEYRELNERIEAGNEMGDKETKMTKTRLTGLTAEITDDAIRVRNPRGGIWYPDEEAEAEIRGVLIVCESPDGYSIHAPGSSDEEIASGDAPPLVTGPWIDDEHIVPASAFDEARRVLAARICEQEPMRGTWHD